MNDTSEGGSVAPGARQRRRRQLPAHFATLASLFDATTFRHIATLGIRPGWRCWEVGAGGSSVPSWLAEQVGSDGYVLATDTEIDQHLTDLAKPTAASLDLVSWPLVAAWGRKP